MMKEIKSLYETIIKQLQANVSELEVSNRKFKGDVNDLREGLKEVKRYSVESEHWSRRKIIRIYGLKRIPKAVVS